MKIIIDIDNDLYTRLFDAGEIYVMDMQRVCVAVRKGKVISEERRKLKDIDPEYEDILKKIKEAGESNDWTNHGRNVGGTNIIW